MEAHKMDGKENDALGTFPITETALYGSNKQAPSLLYEFITRSTGEAILRFHCLPSQPINEDFKLWFAVSINDGTPVIMNASLKEVMHESNAAWKTNLLQATHIAETKVTISQTGKHQVKITMMDLGVVLDKIEFVG